MEIIKEKELKNPETDNLEDDTKASVENRYNEENIENKSSNSIFNTLDLNQ